MSRVELAKISSLTFYKDGLTAARRTDAWPQLNCVGSACKLYQPEAVRCVNTGGSGTDIDWKCEADLPEALRFGKVEVNCEGWSRPGDPYVLKGSCALEYRLVQVPDALRKGRTDSPIYGSSESTPSYDLSTIIFWLAWFGILAFILSRFLESFWHRDTPGTARGPNTGPTPGPGGGGGGRGWFPGSPPPPYSKNPPQGAQPQAGWQNWRPGFWTGAAVAGLANHLWNRRNEERAQRPPIMRPAEPYGWEQQWNPFSTQPTRRSAYRRPSHFDNNDRGEGSSNLGAMRSSTGIGGSNVR
ncbi:hypothetical protein DFP72DRAFT_892292 [Ephemerocybe angulata]|uniref:Store-operated calcium entry-associated regulatory factor n=1 Tax=Ephemerocybe angulata TaxID=980116 RepID=A0A8H6I1Q6_9AGAR|nr:hypothetical protein DFP72DRAFT_892292 [Tulosesus angulatus]